MQIEIAEEKDIKNAVEVTMKMASRLKFDRTRVFMIGTSVSELARNILNYADTGIIHLTPIRKKDTIGIEIIATDQGPGIENIDLAMKDHYSTGKSLGIGLPGTKRLMDDFEINSEVGVGTKIRIRKWL